MVSSLRLTNIRCFKNARFEFAPGVNLVVGPNGSGKTTVLEAVGLFVYGRFQSVERDFLAVANSQECGRVELTTQTGGEEKDAEVAILEGEKIFKLQDKKIASSKIIGFTKVIFFNPETIGLVAGSPQLRRRELDTSVAQKKPSFVRSLLHLKKILRERNSLLRQIALRRADESELDFWDGELVKYAPAIYKERQELLGAINEGIAEVHNSLVEKERNLHLSYLPSIDYARFDEALAAVRESDLRLGLSSAGPHRDDFTFADGDFILKEGGSRGEQRMAAIAFKLEAKKYLAGTNEEPTLILDDVFSELDADRREAVARILGEGQVIISATDERVVPKRLLEQAKMIKLEQC